MKALVLMLACAAVVLTAAPAQADNARLTRLLNATMKDYETITASFMRAKGNGAVSWEAYRVTVDGAVARVTARREALVDMDRQGVKTMTPGQRALVRMLVRDIDEINLSLLALVCDGRGHAGYLRTGDKGLIKGIDDWQTGIWAAIRQTGRCIKLAGRITFPLHARPGLRAVPSH